ncbi:uncharacterized protein [Leptinotarsa decemlineata]|uniref:uncharacterized protein n=1 Tax=Leptinotarsa decemlineata TaxID=7539 RepID=UPI003D30AD9E
MSTELSETEKRLIKVIADQNGFTDYQVEAQPGAQKGDNYFGIITSVSLKDKNKSLELICKSAHSGEVFREKMPIHEQYVREIHLYESVLSEFKKFQEEYAVPNPFVGFPKFYGKYIDENNECFFLENLKKSGYTHWDRKLPMNSEHIKAVLAEYAKFHATSLAMRQLKPEMFKNLTENIKTHVFEKPDRNENDEMGNMFMTTAIKNALEIVGDNSSLIEAVRRAESGLIEDFASEDPSYDIVVTHGDCWCNNILFKYEDETNTSKPTKVCFIDWQLTKVGSPAMDVLYFFFLHSPKDILCDYETYLKFYYEVLCRYLRDFSCDPEDLFPFSTLQKHWKKFVNLQLLMSIMMLKTMLCDSEEALDLEKMTEDSDNIFDTHNFTIKNESEYHRRVRDIIESLMETGLL